MEAIQITVKGKTAAEVQKYLKRFISISSTYVIDAQTIKIYYDPEKIQCKRIIKLVGKCGQPDNKAKVTSLKEPPQ